MNSICIESSLVDNNIVSTNREEVLRHLFSLLHENNNVDNEYLSNILQREDNYPTGIQFADIAIAIPHGDAEHVIKSAIAIGKCTNKVEFHNMESPEDTIKVDYVVMLAVDNPDEHISVLNNLITLFSDDICCKDLISAKSQEDVCKIFREKLYL